MNKILCALFIKIITVLGHKDPIRILRPAEIVRLAYVQKCTFIGRYLIRMQARLNIIDELWRLIVSRLMIKRGLARCAGAAPGFDTLRTGLTQHAGDLGQRAARG
jgi:hypothetical protein